jgi:hypothetical protein
MLACIKSTGSFSLRRCFVLTTDSARTSGGLLPSQKLLALLCYDQDAANYKRHTLFITAHMAIEPWSLFWN